MVGNNEGSMVLGLKLPNLLGRAEKVTFQFSYGTKETSYGLSFFKPQPGNFERNFSVNLYKVTGQFPWSSLRETDRGVSAEYSGVSSLCRELGKTQQLLVTGPPALPLLVLRAGTPSPWFTPFPFLVFPTPSAPPSPLPCFPYPLLPPNIIKNFIHTGEAWEEDHRCKPA
ncbi:uncharacterized protein LOC101707689 isoform X1 [Heterocephalus glaber]|uniref:Uncharacterized protein LOC101707689 isoform X1 n=1 Tax=Heterocephalus glaber TaxID=10181 RepID=A0AAX6T0B1_HETGA|nr:uncharacterized protein LOC101707689 isoform X1 [Heterocephalus glaber]